jgi:hypothetical protein
MQHSESLAALAPAFVKAQAEFEPVLKCKINPHFRNKYAPLEEIVASVRPVLKAHGLTVFHTFSPNGGTALHIETTLMHESGEFITSTLAMPLDKNTPQGVGSAITYGRRYALAAILGVVSDEDDDAEAATDRSNGQKPPKASAKPRGGDLEDYL